MRTACGISDPVFLPSAASPAHAIKPALVAAILLTAIASSIAGESRIKSSVISADNSPDAIARAKQQGAKSALADIQAGQAVILYFGKPWSAGKPLVDDATGLRVEIVTGCVASAVFAAEVEAYNDAVRAWHVTPTLAIVAGALQPILERLAPETAIEFPKNYPSSLHVFHLPQKYTIHGRSKTGEVGTNTFEKVGPGFRGFVLRVHVQRKGEVNQAVTPQTLREPYWFTDLDVTPIGRTDKQIYWALSHAGRPPTNTLHAIRAALKQLEERK